MKEFINICKLQVDVSNYDEIIALKEKIKNDLGDVDILINNAAVLPRVSLLQGNPEDIFRIVKVNLLSHFWVNPISIPSSLLGFHCKVFFLDFTRVLAANDR